MFCIKCGAKLPEGAQFCYKCGSKAVDDNGLSLSNHPSIQESKTAVDISSTMTKTPLVQASFIKNHKVPIVIILCICLIGFICFAVTITTINSKKAQRSNEFSAMPTQSAATIVEENDIGSSGNIQSISPVDGDNVKFSYFNGDYVGTIKNGIREGSGEFTYANGDKYIGLWNQDLMDGYGQLYYANGDLYSGDFKLGQRKGKGKVNYADGSVFDGEWLNNMREGKGSFHAASGEIYIGSYSEDLKNGYGEYYFKNGDIYKGEFQDDKFNGVGEYISTDASKAFKGNWVNGESQK